MDTESSQTFRPSHMAFATFWNFIGDLASRPLPPQIDRSMLRNKSGTDQSNLMSTLSSFGLIGPAPEHRVQQALVDLATTDMDKRKAELAKLIRHHYSAAVTISDRHGTDQQLHDVFRDTYGMDSAATRRKAVTFFLHAARAAELPVSANFPATRSGSGLPGVPRAKRMGRRKPVNGTNGDTPGSGIATEQHGPNGDTYTVTLASGGEVSVVVSVNLFELSTRDRDYVIGLVDTLKGYTGADGQTATEERAS
jgi:hypothetical protein